MSRRPRIAVLAGFWPAHRLDNAGSLTVRHRVNYLQRNADVVLFVRDEPGVLPHALGVEPGVAVVRLRTPSAGRLSSAITKVATGDISLGRAVGRSWMTQLSHHAGTFDAVEVHWSQHFGLVDGLRRLFPEAVLVAYAHDVMTQSLERRGARASSAGSRAVARLAAQRARRREPRLLNRFDRVATFSDKDRRLLADLGVRVPIDVDQLYFDLRDEVALSEAPHVVFMGALQRRENDEAARWLVDDIWPTVIAELPSARLTIAGSSPSSELLAAARSVDSVDVTGFVDDLATVYRSAGLVVAPLLTGAGVKVKVLDAWASGLPVVATTVGAEGLPVDLFGAVTDDPEEFAHQVVRLLGDATARERLRERARAWTKAAHDHVDVDLDRTMALYRAVVGRTQVG